jgi:hypothetical protein
MAYGDVLQSEIQEESSHASRCHYYGEYCTLPESMHNALICAELGGLGRFGELELLLATRMRRSCFSLLVRSPVRNLFRASPERYPGQGRRMEISTDKPTLAIYVGSDNAHRQ